MSTEKVTRRDKLVEIGGTFPETTVEGDHHLQFKVRGKSFAWYLDNHHGDGKIALCCKAAPGDQEFLIQADGEKFFRPAYLGANGWIGVRIDTPAVDWGEIRGFMMAAYKLNAPKRLAAALEQKQK
jgi:hypothetical protein